MAAVLKIICMMFAMFFAVGLFYAVFSGEKIGITKDKRQKFIKIYAALIAVFFLLYLFFGLVVDIEKQAAEDILTKAQEQAEQQRIEQQRIAILGAVIITDENIGSIATSIYREHRYFTAQLAKRYMQYKEAGDDKSYTQWRDSEWQSEYGERSHYYDAMREANRKIIFNNDMMPFFIAFANLRLQAHDVLFALLRDDYSHIESFKLRAGEDIAAMEAFLDKHNLER